MKKRNHLFPSHYKHGDKVKFIPMAKDLNRLSIEETVHTGTITKVSFTIKKVFYDIIDDYYGHLFKDVDSGKVGEENIALNERQNLISNN